MKKLLSAIFLFSVLSTSFTKAQTNTVFMELGGNGLVWSLNYDRMITEKISIRVGYGFFQISDLFFNTELQDDVEDSYYDSKVSLVPIVVNYLLGSGNHKLEIGLGIRYAMVEGNGFIWNLPLPDNGSETSATGVLGYRYHSDTGGFSFRLSLAPIYHEGREFFAMPGLSLGYSF